ncbi:MAG: hypothetical protein KA821_17760 [Chitinophagaceae bacterium]|nr:hypothetical protein [Chitinophagaceae bacterium]
MKSNIFKLTFWCQAIAGSLLLALAACTPDVKNGELGALPQADFEVLPGPDANTVILVNKSNQASIPYWTVSTGAKLNGDSARLKLIFAGTYQVTLTAAGRGGMGTVTKDVTIANSDPNACNPSNPIGFIAGCTSKKWKLNPEAGTYKVGEGPDMGNWWSSGAGDVTGRACEFNDEYIFSFNAEGTFVYDNKGDYYADGYIGASTFGCEPNSNLSGAQAAWASGNFNFTVIDGGGVRGLGQLRLSGTGAHIGLQKVHNGGETTSGPVGNSITYDILEMRQNVNGLGYDILKVGLNIGGAGWWTFTLRSY